MSRLDALPDGNDESNTTTATTPSDRSPAKPALLSRAVRPLVRHLLRAAGDPPLGVKLWTGEQIVPRGVEPRAVLEVRGPAVLFGLLVNPSWTLGEGYSDGRLEVSGDLVEFLTIVNRALLAQARPSLLRELRTRLRSAKITVADARRNAHSHYDLSNEFYRLWLDDRQLYSCAYFVRRGMTLEEAQAAKMDHVCRKLRLRPGQTVVEAGCGWGALAMHMARRYGAIVKAYNVAHEQVAAARRRAEDEGLGRQVEFIEGDWRTIEGSFDVFVSVGMLEHVGARNYRRLGDVIDQCLKPDGRALIHTIGRNAVAPLDPWIRRRIFPGAHVPAWAEMKSIFEPHQFSIVDVENLRLHYSETLRHWLRRFENSIDVVRRMFGERFVRMWRYYLCGSIATFDVGWLQLFQVVFTRPDDNTIPRTREYIYASGCDAATCDCFTPPAKESL